MATFKRDGFGQIELNHVAFRRDGRIEAQSDLDPAVFKDGKRAENGMILAVDKSKNLITGVKAGLPVAINYSAEHMYDERINRLKDFSLGVEDVRPRLGYLAVGDIFTTNAVVLGSDFEAVEDANLDSDIQSKIDTLKGYASASGYIEVTGVEQEDASLVLKVAAYTTMPDGQPAFKFHVVKA